MYIYVCHLFAAICILTLLYCAKKILAKFKFEFERVFLNMKFNRDGQLKQPPLLNFNCGGQHKTTTLVNLLTMAGDTRQPSQLVCILAVSLCHPPRLID